jgi:hypothetical protein
VLDIVVVDNLFRATKHESDCEFGVVNFGHSADAMMADCQSAEVWGARAFVFTRVIIRFGSEALFI